MATPTYSLPTAASSPMFAEKAAHEAAINVVIRQLVDIIEAADGELSDRVSSIVAGFMPVGEWDASSGTFPSEAQIIGTFYVVREGGAGTVDGVSFAVGDQLLPLVTSPSTATYVGNWVRNPRSEIVDRIYSSVSNIEITAESRGAGSRHETQEGFLYTQAPDDATDHDMTWNGVKLYGTGVILTPTQFGVVVGVGQAAGVGLNNVLQINKMLSRAASIGAEVSFPNGATIEIANGSEPIKIPSRIIVNGNRCVIQAQNDTGPIVVSKAWADNTEPGGTGCVSDLIAQGTLADGEINTGDPSSNSQDGFIVYDYQSNWIRLEARRCRGRGIVAEERNSLGGTVVGSLVENRFEQCEARNCAGRGFDFAPSQLGKLTDGWLLDPIVHQPAGCTERAISVNVGAGWNIGGYHTYAGDPARAIVIARGYNTNIGDGYIETFTRSALYLPEAQQNVKVGNVNVRSNKVSHANAATVEVETRSGVTTANITILSIQDENNTGGAHELIRNVFGATLPVQLGSYQVQGANAGLIALPDNSDTWFSIPARGAILGRLDDNIGENLLEHNGWQLMKGVQQQWSLGGAQSLTFSIPYVSCYHMNRKLVCDLTIFSFQNQNGDLLATYVGKLLISARDSGGAWKAALLDVVAPSGFSAKPAVNSITVTGALSGTNPNGLDVEITFTPTDTDGYGTASLLLGPTLGN